MTGAVGMAVPMVLVFVFSVTVITFLTVFMLGVTVIAVRAVLMGGWGGVLHVGMDSTLVNAEFDAFNPFALLALKVHVEVAKI